MAFKKIMVPYDGSEHAKSALVIAKEFLKDNDCAQLHIVSIVPVATIPPALNLRADSYAGPAVSFANYQEYQDLVTDALSSTIKELEDVMHAVFDNFDRITCAAIPSESIASGITSYAQDNSCDIIIMGRRGLGALRGMLGSVSFAVLRSAEIPVLTVK